MRRTPISTAISENGADRPRGQIKTENRAVRASGSTLTAAEKRILALVSLAKTNKEIARALGISPSTVKRHLENVLKKLHLKNRIEVAIYGLSVNGCPQEISHGCPLKTWHVEKAKAARLWAE
jgi:DNA-binding CsgD family transcriptional regulator